MSLLGDVLSWIDSAKRVGSENIYGLLTDPLATTQRLGYQAVENIDESLIQPALRGDTTGMVQGLLGSGVAGPLTFAGVNAKTANMAALAKAREMVKSGADPGDVWRKTGWTDQFPDKKWRFEISDDKSVLSPRFLFDMERGSKYANKNPVTEADIRAMRSIPDSWTANKVMQHDNLWSAYADTIPYYKTERLPSDGPKGAFAGEGAFQIGIAPAAADDMRSTMLHELQHAIQQREGFARGGSPQAAVNLPEVNRLIMKLESELDAAREAGDRKLFDQLYEKIYRLSSNNGMEAYRNLAGEAEARLVQKRMDLTPAQRKMQLPWLSFDVLPEQQIVYGLLGR